MDLKICKICQQEKPLSEFRSEYNKKSIPYYRMRCNTCKDIKLTDIYQKQYYDEHREEIKKKSKMYYEKNREKCLLKEKERYHTKGSTDLTVRCLFCDKALIREQYKQLGLCRNCSKSPRQSNK